MVFHVVKECGHNFHFVTNHEFDRQTDRILIARPRLHSTQRGKNEVNMERLLNVNERKLVQNALCIGNRSWETSETKINRRYKL